MSKPSKITQNKITENQATVDCLAWVRQLGWYAHRNQVGLFYTRDGRPVKIGVEGTPDWLLLHPEHGIVWLEMKSSTGKPSKLQRERLAMLRHLGFRVGVARSVMGLAKLFEDEWGLPI
jgi:hypothetical protein